MAIDPPYRLDPFRNIINVKWQEGPPTSLTYQYFRFAFKTPYFPGSYEPGGESTYWEPVTEEFVEAAQNNGEASDETGGVPNIGAAENHSDLIEMFRTGSDPALITAWLTQYYVVGSWHRATASYPTWHGDYLYLFVTGIYWVDDLTA